MSLLPVEDALARLLDAVPEAPAVETVPLGQALQRVLAATVTSAVTVPPTDNAAVDGYAIRHADLADTPAVLPVSQRIPAGSDPAPLAAGTAARIFTGATVPAGADTVLMQENCESDGDTVTLPVRSDVTAGSNIRPAGQDMEKGAEVVEAGTRLDARHLGLLASVGVDRLRCYRPLTIAVLSTGDELVEPGEPAGPGQIYNSNRYLLCALIREAGFVPLDLGRVADTPEATEVALARAAGQADLVLSTGGVSVGEEDHVRAAVESLGALDLWRLAIKPGKPFAFGHVQSAQGASVPFMGLPGNPSAVLVTFLILVLPWLRKAQGRSGNPCVLPWRLPADFEIRRSAKREEYLRVRLVQSNGQTVLEKHPNQSSGMLSSAAWADGLAVVPVGTSVAPEQPLAFLPFGDLLG